jgi:hypothetical protein
MLTVDDNMGVRDNASFGACSAYVICRHSKLMPKRPIQSRRGSVRNSRGPPLFSSLVRLDQHESRLAQARKILDYVRPLPKTSGQCCEGHCRPGIGVVQHLLFSLHVVCIPVRILLSRRIPDSWDDSNDGWPAGRDVGKGPKAVKQLAGFCMNWRHTNPLLAPQCTM